MPKQILNRLILALSINLGVISVCTAAEAGASDKKKVKQAVAVLNPTAGNRAQGKVTFTAVEGGVLVAAAVDYLEPGKHGFFIHEWGDCSAADGASIGPHFNPNHAKHGAPEAYERHAGDLGNIVADEKGRARYERLDKNITLEGPNSIMGRSVGIHANADDYTTQPSGNAGGVVSCGIIEP